ALFTGSPGDVLVTSAALGDERGVWRTQELPRRHPEAWRAAAVCKRNGPPAAVLATSAAFGTRAPIRAAHLGAGVGRRGPRASPRRAGRLCRDFRPAPRSAGGPSAARCGGAHQPRFPPIGDKALATRARSSNHRAGAIGITPARRGTGAH